MIVQTIAQTCAKYLISRLKLEELAISLVAMATATLLLFFDVVFELIEERIWFIYFSGSLVGSFCSLCLFTEKLRESFNRKR